MIMNHYYDLKMQRESSRSVLRPSFPGIIKDLLIPSELKEDIEDIENQISSLNLNLINNLNPQEKNYVTVEYPLQPKKKIWNDKFNSSNLNILTTKLLKTLEVELISKEKDFKPFWNGQSKDISKKLWLPTKTDCVDSVLNSSKQSSLKPVMGESWFSIKEKHPQKLNSQMTSFQLSQYSLHDYTGLEVINSKRKSKKQPKIKDLKTLKIRLFPTKKERDELKIMFDQQRWYYNATLSIMKKRFNKEEILNKEEWSNHYIRDLVRKYNYVETKENDLLIKDFIFDENREEVPLPYWWNKVHSRIPRGANYKFTYALNSCISNKKAGNINDFEMKYISRKNDIQWLHFEDSGFPKMITKIKSRYWYRENTKNGRRRKNNTFNEIFESNKKRGLEIIYQNSTDKYYLHYPIENDWYPETDIRNENQELYKVEGDRIISLDPGIRKFLVGYDPKGKSIFIGEEGQKKIIPKLLYIDTLENKKDKLIEWKKIKGYVNELQWKTINYLIKNYDVILLPTFETSKMIKSRKLGRLTKRMMNMYSFYKFKEKLKYKCNIYGKKLIIVDESYTSCTCGVCGEINKELGGGETYKCNNCETEIDRDQNGSRNILLKNVTLRSG